MMQLRQETAWRSCVKMKTAAVNGALSLEFSLPAHAVSYLVIE